MRMVRITGPTAFGGPSPDPALAMPQIDLAGAAARHTYELGDVDFVQTGALYRTVMTDTDREHLVNNIVGHLKMLEKRIQLRQTALFYKADKDYGKRVAKGLGLDAKGVERLAAMSPGRTSQGHGRVTGRRMRLIHKLNPGESIAGILVYSYFVPISVRQLRRSIQAHIRRAARVCRILSDNAGDIESDHPSARLQVQSQTGCIGLRFYICEQEERRETVDHDIFLVPGRAGVIVA